VRAFYPTEDSELLLAGERAQAEVVSMRRAASTGSHAPAWEPTVFAAPAAFRGAGAGRDGLASHSVRAAGAAKDPVPTLLRGNQRCYSSTRMRTTGSKFLTASPGRK
jgi:hypothetical protein